LYEVAGRAGRYFSVFFVRPILTVASDPRVAGHRIAIRREITSPLANKRLEVHGEMSAPAARSADVVSIVVYAETHPREA
jgi:hypothetical protein